MHSLKQKIKETTLFSDEDKIAILAAVDTYPAEDAKRLEAIVDEFDATYRAAVSEYKSSVYDVLDDVVTKANPQDKQRFQAAAATIRSGIDLLL